VTASILKVTPDEYHALPHFSSTLAKTLIAQSPRHAREARGKNPTKVMDRGNVIHRLVLGKGKDYEVLNFNDFKTNAAKAARDAARKAGKVPVLADDFEEHCKASESIRVELAERNIFLDGESEFAVTWFEPTKHGPVQCRAMFDHVWLKAGRLLDLKITDNAAPGAIERNAETMGYAIQWAAYTRALAALDPKLAGRVDFLFGFCEPDSPFAINLVRPDGMFRELGERRWLRAVETWAECLETDTWPAYGTGINQLSSPPWALSREDFAA
jgi:hypothetical protein